MHELIIANTQGSTNFAKTKSKAKEKLEEKIKNYRIQRASIERPLFIRRAANHRSGAFLCNLHKFTSFFLQNFVTFTY